MTHPRVVHLGFQPIGSPTNSGLTLGSMFHEWPEDRLMQVCMRPEPLVADRPNVLIAPARVAPVDGLVRAALGHHVPSGAIDGLNNSVSRRGRSMSLMNRVRVAATTVNDIGPVHLPRDLARAIADFRPDAIHSLLGGVRPMRLALKVSRLLDVPVVPHFMDDWPANLFADGRLGGVPRRTANKDLQSILRRSPVLLAIGEDMQVEFQDRYSIPTGVVGNSVDLDDFRRIAEAHRPPPDGLKLRYVGGLHLGRDELVHLVASAIEAHVASGGAAWEIELFVPPSDAALAQGLDARHGLVTYRGSLAPDQVPPMLTSSHAQLFIESSDPDIARFTRLSVSTKVPQYLAAGRPVLVLGNPDQGSVRTLLRSGLGIYAGSADTDSLSVALRALDAQGRGSSRSVADLEGIDASTVRRRLAEWMSRAASEWPGR